MTAAILLNTTDDYFHTVVHIAFNGLHTLELELFAPCPSPAPPLTCRKMTTDSTIKLQMENEDRSGEDDDCWLRHHEIAKTSVRQKHYQIYFDLTNSVNFA